jgi:hypothetical protein
MKKGKQKIKSKQNLQIFFFSVKRQLSVNVKIMRKDPNISQLPSPLRRIESIKNQNVIKIKISEIFNFCSNYIPSCISRHQGRR